MSLHAIKISADVFVAISDRSLRCLLDRNIKPLAASATSCEMQMKTLFKKLGIVRLESRKNVKKVWISCLQLSFPSVWNFGFANLNWTFFEASCDVNETHALPCLASPRPAAPSLAPPSLAPPRIAIVNVLEQIAR
jgi:hypothetical protein